MQTLAPRPRAGKPRLAFGLGILPPTSDLDRAWKQGFDLGRDGVRALAPSEWPLALKDSFRDGYSWGEVQADADRESAFLDELAMLNTLNRPEGGDLW